MDQTKKILIIDDEPPIRDVLAANLRDDGYVVDVAPDGLSGLKKIIEFSPDIVFLDIWMPGKMDGLDVLTQAKVQFPRIEFVMISGHGTIETAVKATKLGAWDFIEKPLSMDKINIVLSHIRTFQLQQEEKSALLSRLRKNLAIIGDTLIMKDVKEKISKAASDSEPFFITGGMGTGKQLVAQNLHYMSSRVGANFVEMNCANVPQDLIESELFGIEAFAMPGVEKTKSGKIDIADRGTFLIKEIQQMPLTCQKELAKFIQTKSFTRVGGKAAVERDVRIILATTLDLTQLAQQALLAQELFDLMKTHSLHLPPLKERKEDILHLISHFSDHFCADTGEAKKAFSEKAVERMRDYPWAGNIRELRNFIERVYILTPGDFVDVHDLIFAGMAEHNGLQNGQGSGPGMDKGMKSFREARAHFEKEYLVKKINENQGNISRTAEVIGLERSYLHRKIKLYGIEVNA